MAEGLVGAFIVRQPDSSESHSALYDKDLSDHVIMINDWTDVDFMEIYEADNHDGFIADIGEKYGIGGNSTVLFGLKINFEK